MKFMYTSVLLLLLSTFCIAQVDNIYIPPAGGVGFWIDNNNWSLGTVPNGNHNVIINSGTVVMEGNFGFGHSANTVTISNGARLRINEAGHSLTTNSTTAITIEEDGIIELENGDFGELTLNSGRNIVNHGYLYLVNIILDNGTIENSVTGTIENTSFSGSGSVTNNGEIRTVSGNFNIFDNVDVTNNNTLEVRGGLRLNQSTITNTVNAMIDLQNSIVEINNDDDGLVINEGQIIKTGNAQTAAIEVEFENRNGATLQTNTGTLFIRPLGAEASFLDGSIINVQSGSNLTFESDPVNLSGTITGMVNGAFTWQGTIDITTNAATSFTGGSPVLLNGATITGGGVYTNNSNMEVIGNFSTNIEGNTQMDNNGIIEFDSNIDIENGILNNLEDGIFELNFTGFVFQNAGLHQLNNMGLINKNLNNNSTFTVNFNNEGILDIQTGTIRVQGNEGFINEASGTIMGNGTIENFQNTANFQNNGIIAPGASPGQLTYIGDYPSTATSVLRIDINGLTPVSDYDRLNVIGTSGQAQLNGNVEVILGFDPDIGDEFVVFTSSGNINQCNLPTETTAIFGNTAYEFSVECRNNNQVVLTVLNQTLNTNDIDLNSVGIYPNPASDKIHIALGDNQDLKNLVIYSIAGQQVMTSANSTLDVSALTSGTYFVHIQTNLGETYKMLLID